MVMSGIVTQVSGKVQTQPDGGESKGQVVDPELAAGGGSSNARLKEAGGKSVG
jgi:hypothetical protein